MKPSLIWVLTALLLVAVPFTVSGTQKKVEELPDVTVPTTYDVEFKPMAFYYEIDPYLPIKVLLEGSGFVLDPLLGSQVEKAVGRSAFMADPGILRRPVVVSDVYDLDNQTYDLDVARYRQKGVASWEVEILDMSGMIFRILPGKGSLPEFIAWDGRGEDGKPLSVGDAYTFNIHMTTRDEATLRKGGGIIDVNGIAYENVVAIKESQMDIGSVYPAQVSRKVADYYQLVLNRFKEGGYSRIVITASDKEYAEAARDYLTPRLVNTVIVVQEDPEFPRLQFVFE
ncbi:hypothetical protein JXM67_13895 [candidate division WOR-3 bacterium]|nr:hypothetical protein [candidate division WOR-3 bacterium]